MIESMLVKNIILFLIVSGLAGVCIFLGSVVGHSLGKLGLFGGAVIGGIAGVALAVWLAARFRLVERRSFALTLLGGIVGFAVAAVIAVNNLHGPLIPMASVGVVGLGAVIGNIF